MLDPPQDKLGQLRKTGQVTVWTTTNEAHMSRPRKQLLSAMAHAIMRAIGVVRALDSVRGNQRITNSTVLA